MSYEDLIAGLSQGTVRVVEQLWNAVEAGRLTTTDFHEIAADLIAVARQQGALAAQAALRAYLEANAATATIVAVAPSYAERARLAAAIGTILASDHDTLMQLTRLATNEPMDAAADAYSWAMERAEGVTGWTRGLDAKACQLCRWWARDGRVWRPDHPMPRHPGCLCHQVPVIGETPTNRQSARQAADALASRQRRNR